MSLEVAIKENTETMRQLIATLKAMGDKPVPEATAKAVKTIKVEEKKHPSGDAPIADSQSSTTTEDAVSSAPSTPEQPTYEATASYLVSVSKKLGRTAALSILEKFCTKKGKDDPVNLKMVSPERFAEVIEACNEALEGEIA